MKFGNNSKFLLGDSEVVLRTIQSESVDLIVTDPPYGTNYMGKDWDKALLKIEILKECERVLKPGGFGFFMASNRQNLYSRMVERLERAGFLVDFPSLSWAYAKSHSSNKKFDDDIANIIGREVKELSGFCAGFTPKPAFDNILVAMKPLSERTYSLQALYNGKGISNMEACRIPYPNHDNPKGKIPSTLLVSDKVLDYGDRSFSDFFDLDAWFWNQMNISALPPEVRDRLPFLDVPKPSTKEKEAGLEHLPAKRVIDERKKARDKPYGRDEKLRKNIHPTVKPINLMSYLIVMGSREGDLILDPFAGSGSTCIAAALFRRDYTGIEIKPKYYEIAITRLKYWSHKTD